jgi:hypothetical protein
VQTPTDNRIHRTPVAREDVPGLLEQRFGLREPDPDG